MANKLIQSIIPTNIGGSYSVNVEGNHDTVHIKPAGAITLTSALNITVTGTPISNTEILFIYGGTITTDTATGKSVNIFGTELTNAQALYEGEIKAYYNGSSWEIKIFPDAESGLATLDGAALVAQSIPTTAIIDKAITITKVADMTRGTVRVGGTGNLPIDLNAKTTNYILIGDGTDVKSVPVSGAITLNSSGVATIPSGYITNSMLATPPQTYFRFSSTFNPTQIKSMNTSPITIIPAPGIGKTIRVLAGFIWLEYGTSSYAAGGQLELRLGSDVTAISLVGSITASTNLLSNIAAIGTATTTSLNQALLLSNATTDFTTGDSEVKIVVYYSIEDFN